MINKQKTMVLDKYFYALKENPRSTSAIVGLSKELNTLFGKEFTIGVIRPNDKNQACNVMSVFPDESTISKIIESIVGEKPDAIISKLWAENKSWTCEIDSRILDNKFIDLSAQELTALLMHEVGHVVTSNRIPRRISNIVRYEYAKTQASTKYMMKSSIFKNILAFPIINACVLNTNESSIKEEMSADSYAIKAGYGKELISAIDKIIIKAGESENANKEMEEMTLFSIDTVIQLQKRQNKAVKGNLRKLILSTPSNFIRSIISSVSNLFVEGSDVTSVTESVKADHISGLADSLIDEFYATEYFFGKSNKLKRIDPADLDYITLQIQNIKSNDDRMMIISYIYSKIDMIDYYISLINSGTTKYTVPHSKESLEQMKSRLEKSRNMVMNYKVPEIKYGINIGYPIGYEG